MVTKIEKLSIKFIKPIVPTPPTHRHYTLGVIDEFVTDVNVGVVLFFSTNIHHNLNFVSHLEKSLEKTLTLFYPLAGRYVEETQIVDCNDQGAEFTHAKVNIKLQDLLVSEMNVNFIDEFIPSRIGVARDALLATQVTIFECGGVAIGINTTHKIVDASTLCIFINEWSVRNREENEVKFIGPGFNSSLIFPPRGLRTILLVSKSDDTSQKYTRKKISFSESVISNMKANGRYNTQRLSKVQLVSAIIWQTFINFDLAIRGHRRESIHIQPVNLRERMGSLIPKNSCGNLWGFCVTKAKDVETIESLVDCLTDSVKKTITNFSSRQHNRDEAKEIVMDSLSNATRLALESFNNVVILTSWCKFPFYEADFGFGKPIWAAPEIMPQKNMAYLMDDAKGNGVEAYVFLEIKDVPCFEKVLDQVIAKAS